MTGQRTPLDRSRALARLAAHPALPELISTLPARTLTRLYDAVGLADAGALMEITPPELLVQALTEAVWHEHGASARFDADAFVDWLEVWLDAGDAFTAERLCAFDEDTLALAFAELLRVEDSHVSAFWREPDDTGEPLDTDWLLQPDDHTALFDRFLVSARQPDEWDLARNALLALWDHDPERLLALLDRLSVVAAHASRRGAARLHDDAAAARETRREREGFVSAEAARAFLGMATALDPDALAGMQAYDPESGRHLRGVRRAAADPRANTAPVANAGPASDAGPVSSAGAGDAGGELHALLFLAGVTDAGPATSRLSGPERRAPTTLEQYLQTLAHTDPEALQQAAAELAYLSNVLRATPQVTAPADGSPMNADERARSGAAAVTNLGVELLEARGIRLRAGQEPGLIQPFLAGWRTLGEVPGRLLRALEEGMASTAVQQRLATRAWLVGEIEQSLDDLRRAVAGDDHDAARAALGVLSLIFDADACRAALHLLEVPAALPVGEAGAAAGHSEPVGSRSDLERLGAVLQVLRAGARTDQGTRLSTSFE